MSCLLEVLIGYQTFHQQEEERQFEASKSNKLIYRLFNPYQGTLNDLLMDSPQEVIIDSFKVFFHSHLSHIAYHQYFEKLMTTASKRSEPLIFTEPCFYAVSMQPHHEIKDLAANVAMHTLKTYPLDTQSSCFQKMIDELLHHSCFREASFHGLLTRLAKDNDRSTTKALISRVDLNKLAENVYIDDIIQAGGDDFFLFLIELGFSPVPREISILKGFNVSDVERLFGSSSLLPASLPDKYASILPLVIYTLIKSSHFNDICPISFISLLPAWQQPCVTEHLLQKMN